MKNSLAFCMFSFRRSLLNDNFLKNVHLSDVILSSFLLNAFDLRQPVQNNSHETQFDELGLFLSKWTLAYILFSVKKIQYLERFHPSLWRSGIFILILKIILLKVHGSLFRFHLWNEVAFAINYLGSLDRIINERKCQHKNIRCPPSSYQKTWD